MMNNTEFEGLWYYQQLNLFKMPKSINTQQAILHWREVQSFLHLTANQENTLMAQIEELQQANATLANTYHSLFEEYHELRMKPDRDLNQAFVEIRKLKEINQALEAQNSDLSTEVVSLNVHIGFLAEELNKYRNRPDITLSFGDPDGVEVSVSPRVGCE